MNLFSREGIKCGILHSNPILNNWNLQDTAYSCNGDIMTNNESIVFISHTNPDYTKATKSTWKENRVEIAKRIPFGGMEWKFKTKFHKLPNTPDWVIFSQLWNREQANVVCLVVKKSSKGKVKIELNKKQNHKTTTLYSFYMDEYGVCDIDLQVTDSGVYGKINGVDVGNHSVDIWTKSHHEVKYGMYWSGEIPFDQDNHMVLEYNFN